MNARLRRLAYVVAPLLSLGVLAACGAGGGGAASTSASATRPAVAGAPAAGSVTTLPAAQGPSGTSQATSVLPLGPEGPRVQRSARLVLGVAGGRFDTTLDEIIALVDQAGGYVSGSQAQTQAGQQLRTGQATFQVPADKLDAVLAEVRRKGTPESISISGNDVSQQYVDMQARLRNAEAQRDAMLALMQQAKTVADTVQIENQLGQITGQIEQLKGEIDYLDHSTTFATLSVTIHEVAGGPADQWGLQTAATQALHNVVGVLAFLVLVLGTLAPALLLLVALVAIGLRVWPRLRPSA
jgi:hypothetical protein